MSEWIAVVGTLSGTALGAGATYLTQRQQERRAAAEALREGRRRAYLEFLRSMHGLFLEVRRARLQAREGQRSDLPAALSRIEPLDAQQGLDLVRLAAPHQTAEAAEDLFKFLRAVDPAIFRGTTWHEWHAQYRELRHRFLDLAHADLTE